jgi:hypothetical protein
MKYALVASASARRFCSSFAMKSTAVKKPNVKSMPR